MAGKERIQDEALENIAGGNFLEGPAREHLKEVKKGLSSTIEALGDLVVKTAKLQQDQHGGTVGNGAKVADGGNAPGDPSSPSVGVRGMI